MPNTRKNFPAASAHAVHTGRDGGNKIDQKATTTQIRQLCDVADAGLTEVVHLETTEIATKGAKRRARAVIEVELPD